MNTTISTRMYTSCFLAHVLHHVVFSRSSVSVDDDASTSDDSVDIGRAQHQHDHDATMSRS